MDSDHNVEPCADPEKFFMGGWWWSDGKFQNGLAIPGRGGGGSGPLSRSRSSQDHDLYTNCGTLAIDASRKFH